MNQITFEELLERFDDISQEQLKELWEERNDDIGVVLFENHMLDSSALGDCTAVIVGPSRSIKTIETAEGHHIHDLPSQRQYATAFCLKRG